jgi:hypothetical protein
MDGGQLTVTHGPWWPRAAFFSHPLADIGSFDVGPSAEFENAYDLFLVTKNDLRVRLPIELNGIVVRVNGSKRAAWGHVPVSHATYVAERLTEALERVRHEGGSYIAWLRARGWAWTWACGSATSSRPRPSPPRSACSAEPPRRVYTLDVQRIGAMLVR